MESELAEMREKKLGNSTEYRSKRPECEKLKEFLSALENEVENPEQYLKIEDPELIFQMTNFEREMILGRLSKIPGLDLELRCIEVDKDSWQRDWFMQLGKRYDVPFLMLKNKFFLMLLRADRSDSTDEKVEKILDIQKTFGMGNVIYSKVMKVNE